MRGIPRHNSIKHRAAVITPGLIFYGNGTSVPCDRLLVHDIVRIIDGTDRFEPHCSIIIDGSTIDAVKAAAVTLGERGWKYSDIDAWTVFRTADNTRTVSLGLRDHMNRFRHFRGLFDRDTYPDVLAIRLDRFAKATGNPWRGTPAMSAHNAIRLSWANDRYQPLWRTRRTPAGYAGPLVWKRELTDLEADWGYVHTFDGNSAYLGSAISAELAWSQLHHVGAQPFDPALPGYWLLDLPNEILALSREPGRPPLLPRKTRDTCAWVTTPYAKLLLELATCDVIDSFTCRAEHSDDGRRIHPAGSRILRKWGERTRDALLTYRDTDPAVAAAIKGTYTDMVGAMQREGGRIQRWDWGHTIIDLWRATFYRHILRVRKEIGYWPVKVATDSVSWADSNPDPSVLAKHLGAQPRDTRPRMLGRFHHESTHTTAEWRALNTPRQLAGAR